MTSEAIIRLWYFSLSSFLRLKCASVHKVCNTMKRINISSLFSFYILLCTATHWSNQLIPNNYRNGCVLSANALCLVSSWQIVNSCWLFDLNLLIGWAVDYVFFSRRVKHNNLALCFLLTVWQLWKSHEFDFSASRVSPARSTMHIHTCSCAKGSCVRFSVREHAVVACTVCWSRNKGVGQIGNSYCFLPHDTVLIFSH